MNCREISKNKLSEKVKLFIEIDWLSRPYIYILVCIYFVSRLPLIFQGFGLDTDSWLMGITANTVWYEHRYETTRVPGYPIPEVCYGLFISGEWVATNTLTIIISLVGTLAFAYIVRESHVKQKGLIVLTYAFLPILWTNSATTMDYMWALTFMCISWLFILRDKLFIAGCFFGLAIGSRLTYVFIIFPFMYFI